jgi:hypothetical protein
MEKYISSKALLGNMALAKQYPGSIKRSNTNDIVIKWINKDYSKRNNISTKVENSEYCSDDERQYLHYY